MIRRRPYQVEALDAAFGRFDDGDRSTLVVMPTGTGKTVLAAMACEQIRERSAGTGRTLFVAHRNFLVTQAARTLKRMGLRPTIDMGSEKPNRHHHDVVVATVQTLQGDRLKAYGHEAFDAIVTDECHHANAKSYGRVYKRFASAKHLGITATPGRGDKRNLGAVFDSTAYAYQYDQAVADGWLVKVLPYYVPVQIDLKDINTNVGANRGLNAGDVGERIGPHVEEICAHIVKEVGDRQTVAFTPCVGSSVATVDCLNKMGLPARFVCGNGGRFPMSKAERSSILSAFDRLEFQVLVNCSLLAEGWDSPCVSAVVNMRPTSIQWNYMQMMGRGTRPCPELGKIDCLGLDFDWTASDESRSFCTSIDLYDDGLTPEVRDEALKIIRATPYKDIKSAIDEARDYVRTRPRVEVLLTGKGAEYEKVPRDPKGAGKILGVKIGWYDLGIKGGGPSTQGQVHLLESSGISGAARFSKWGASKMISDLKRREKIGLASLAEVHEMLAAGVEESMARTMGRRDAGLALAEIRAKREAAAWGRRQ
jgi:superfamily II DNA or RNA helicase